jgi:TetR/AcrR family transcriptional regulator, transcriptional repressor for nem operon
LVVFKGRANFLPRIYFFIPNFDLHLQTKRSVLMNDSKEHIIITASRLFLQKSYKEVTMKEIVEETGLSKGAFYHYFKSKEQLFLEVLDYFFTCVMRHAYESYSRESFYAFYHDYANEIRKYSQLYVDKFPANSDEGAFTMNYFTLAFDALKLFPEFKERMKESLEMELGIWTSIIKKAREDGEIKTMMTDEELAQTFIYLSDGVAMHMTMQNARIGEVIDPFLNLWDKLYAQIKA